MEPITAAMVSATLMAVWNGAAGEAGRRGFEAVGVAVRRTLGRPAPAPTSLAELDALAAQLAERMERDPEAARAWRLFGRLPAAAAAPVFSAQFPPSARFFTDRKDAVKELDREASRPADGRPRVALLCGAEGIGTSALAVFWGNGGAGRQHFTDGRIHLDLRGAGGAGSALSPGAVLAGLLTQLGVQDGELPPTVELRLRRFRELVAGRKLLVVLDHAYSAAQINQVITSAPEVFTLVTARNALPGLDAVRIQVGPLVDRDAKSLLVDLAGKQAVASARQVLPDVLARCGGSPIALRSAALRLGETARGQRQSQVAEGAPDGPVAAMAEDTYRLLGPEEARFYRLLALRPWPAITAAAAAGCTETEVDEAARVLGELAGRLLLEEAEPGRFVYRDGVRAHAERVAWAEEEPEVRRRAQARMVGWYRDFAVHAARGALPKSWRVPEPVTGTGDPAARQGDPATGQDDAATGQGNSAAGPDHAATTASVPPRSYADVGEALAALVAELSSLVEAMNAARDLGDHVSLFALGQALWPVQLKAGHHDALLRALEGAVDVAAAVRPGSRVEGALRAQLAHSLIELGRLRDAQAAAQAAIDSERAAGHVRGHASATEFLGLVMLRAWKWDEAYACFERAAEIYRTIGPDDEGAADLDRALALLQRHRGRALRGLGRLDEARDRIESALAYFSDPDRGGEVYNTARALTDLAEVLLEAEGPEAALPHVDEALRLLGDENAEQQVVFLLGLRARCTDGS